MELIFEENKATKNTIRFEEVEDEYGINIGTLYIQKHSLKELNYKTGDKLIVKVEVLKEN